MEPISTDELINKAILLGASDIHFEQYADKLRVRFRINGILHDEISIIFDHKDNIINRIKVLSNLDIAQKRVPQDGKIVHKFGSNTVDLRVSTFPSFYGEKLVLRILDRSKIDLSLNNLGMSTELLNSIKSIISSSKGFFLVAGPTGSGKTTTLYACLSYIKSESKNICTLEDPIEYGIENITQTQIFEEIGFTFQSGIKSLLRQDPDIIMVGEIRDGQTAKVAIQASLTGHFVLSTIHTVDSCGTIIRLLDMGIEPYLINSSISGILSQRLLRVLCSYCKTKLALSDFANLIKLYNLNIKNAYCAPGCSKCRFTGYNSRIGIYELLTLSNKLKALIYNKVGIDDLISQAKADGYKTLLDDACDKVENGIISLEELIRVLF